MNKVIHMYRSIVVIVYLLFVAVGYYAMTNIDATNADDYLMYIGGITLSVVLIWLAQNNSKESFGIFFFWVSCLILILIMGLRNKTAIDDRNYYKIFCGVGQYNFISYINVYGVEIGFKIFTYIMYYLTGGNYFAYQFVCSAIPLIITYRGLWKYREKLNFAVSLLLFISMIYMPVLSAGLVRMFIAISIMFVNYDNLIKGKWKRYTIVTIATATIHVSALFMLILCVLGIKKKSFEKWDRALFSLIMMVPLGMLVIRFIIAPLMGIRYSGYIQNVSFGVSLEQFDKVIFIFLAIFAYRWGKKFYDDNDVKTYNALMILIGLGIVISACSGIINLGRLEYYCRLAIIMMFGHVIKKTHCNELSSIIVSICTMSYAMIFLWLNNVEMKSHYIHLFPYDSFL